MSEIPVARPVTWRDAISQLGPPEYLNPETVMNCWEGHYSWPDRENSEEFERRFKKHWINKWYCTDSWVGIAVLTLDGAPFGISCQLGRKYTEEVEFLSEESVDLVASVLDNLCPSPLAPQSIVDLDAIIHPTWFERGDE